MVVTGHVDAFHADTSTATANGVFSAKSTVTGVVRLKVTARLISVETASILAAPEASTESQEVLAQKTDTTRPSILGIPAGRGSSSTGGGNVQSELLKLVDKDVDVVSADIAKQIETRVAAVIPRSAPAKVVGMQEGLVLINRGATAGVRVGEHFSVVRVVDTGLKDPDTGQPVSRQKKICTVTITEVEDSSALGKLDGEEPLAGDEARPVQN
jgi:hypothetical protein